MIVVTLVRDSIQIIRMQQFFFPRLRMQKLLLEMITDLTNPNRFLAQELGRPDVRSAHELIPRGNRFQAEK
jgi:hypothetical protein